MKREVVILVLTLVLVFGVVQAASAAGGLGFGKGIGLPGAAGLLRQLDLSEDQIEQVKEIREKSYQDTRDLRIELMDLRHELEILMLEGDQDAIKAKQDEIKTLREKLMEITKQSRADCKELLTEDQLSKMEQLRENRMGQRQGKGSGFQRGPCAQDLQ